ncbi:DUF2938 domain-containing protein [Candidatus Pelagibacter sp.]|nr:DUF2938 domain-containing protein [Candidatus Pelagibacter sp.]
MNDILSIVVAGIFSCIILDILGYLLRLIGIPEPSWEIVGRWVYYMIKNAAFYNPKIINMPKFKYEILLGWIFHYYISLCWAVIYYFVFIILGVNMSYFSGLIFGATTTFAPLLMFMPFTGQGIMASNTKNPLKTSFVFLIRHSLYGLAMFEGFRWFT